MSIESALYSELNTILEIQGKIYPMVSPETIETPYLVYNNTSTDEEYILDGVTGSHYTMFDLNLYCGGYSELKTITPKVREKLLSFFQRDVGGFFIQSINLETRDLYESTVGIYRTVLEFEIYY